MLISALLDVINLQNNSLTYFFLDSGALLEGFNEGDFPDRESDPRHLLLSSLYQ